MSEFDISIEITSADKAASFDAFSPAWGAMMDGRKVRILLTIDPHEMNENASPDYRSLTVDGRGLVSIEADANGQ